MKHYVVIAIYKKPGVVYSGSDENKALDIIRKTSGSYELREYELREHTKKNSFINLNVQEFWHGSKFGTDRNYSVSVKELEAIILMLEKDSKRKPLAKYKNEF